MARRKVLAGLLLATLLLAGCTGGTEQVANNLNNFRYTSDWKGYSGTKEYDWENNRTRAEVSLSGTPTAGTVAVSVRDAAGTTVFSTQDLRPNVRTTTEPGVAGTWHIVLDFQGFAGPTTVSIRGVAG